MHLIEIHFKGLCLPTTKDHKCQVVIVPNYTKKIQIIVLVSLFSSYLLLKNRNTLETLGTHNILQLIFSNASNIRLYVLL